MSDEPIPRPYPPYRSKQDRHETPVGVRYNADRRHGSLQDKVGMYDFHNLPDNEYEALMVAPGEPIRVAADMRELTFLFDVELPMDLAGLTEREVAVVDMLVFGQMSLAQCGHFLGLQFKKDHTPYSKAMVIRIRNVAYDKLRKAFNDEHAD